jgi:hypothetical protein
MTAVTENLDALARSWWEAQRWERMDQGGVRALELVVALLRSAPCDSGEATVGAGPLEDLVTEHGSELSPQIEELVRRSAPFRRALASVWLDGGTLAPTVEERLAPWIPALSSRPHGRRASGRPRSDGHTRSHRV